jgi:cation transport regulator ChaB
MPYSSISELPANIKKILPTGAQTIYKNAFDSVYSETKDDGKSASAAWAAVKKAGYVRGSDGNWHKGGQASMPNNGKLIMSSDKIEVIELSDEQMLDENIPNARIPSFRLSKFNHPWYGEIEFTESDLRSVIDNFHGDVVGNELSITATHKGEEAVGWIKDLERRGSQVDILPNMTKEGLELLKSKKYKYASIEYQKNFVDPETGASMGPTLVGLALTNKPFINRQDAITVMSMDDFNDEELESVPPVIVLETRYQKEDIMSEDNKATTPETAKETPVPQDSVTLSRAEFTDLQTKYEALKTNTVELEKQTAVLKAEVRNSHIDRMILSAEKRVTDGKQLAPAVVDWARNFMKGAEINGIALSNDNATDYMDAAIGHLLNNVIPCTVPVESLSKGEGQPRPEDEDKNKDSFTKEDVDRFWN